MPMFVHLAPAPLLPRVRRNGIKREGPGVYCMPVLRDFYLTHQWARELRRRGQRTLIAVYFALPDDEPVLAGRYSEPHREMTATEAVKAMLERPDPLGFEVIVRRSIRSDELCKVRTAPRVLGWRYMPEAHQRARCLCDWCSRGDINRQRQHRYGQKLDRLRAAMREGAQAGS